MVYWGEMVIAKGDSGAANRYCRKEDIACFQLILIDPEVTLLENSVIKSDQKGQ